MIQSVLMWIIISQQVYHSQRIFCPLPKLYWNVCFVSMLTSTTSISRKWYSWVRRHIWTPPLSILYFLCKNSTLLIARNWLLFKSLLTNLPARIGKNCSFAAAYCLGPSFPRCFAHHFTWPVNALKQLRKSFRLSLAYVNVKDM